MRYKAHIFTVCFVGFVILISLTLSRTQSVIGISENQSNPYAQFEKEQFIDDKNAQLIASLKEKYSSWMPERLLQLQYDCSYDVSVYDFKGNVQRSYHAEHPYTRGISLSLYPEWLLYGDFNPVGIIETEKYTVLLYRSWIFLPDWTYMPTDLSWIHGSLIDPDLDRQYDSMKMYYLEESPLLLDRYTDTRCVLIYVDKSNDLIAFTDFIPQYNMLDGLVRLDFNYSDNNLVSSITRRYYETPENRNSETEQVSSAYFENNPPNDADFPGIYDEFLLEYTDRVGYISEVNFNINGKKHTIVRINNFLVSPSKWLVLADGEESFFDRLSREAYTIREARN